MLQWHHTVERYKILQHWQSSMRPWHVMVSDPRLTSASSRCTAARSLACAAWITGAALVMLTGGKTLSALHFMTNRYILHCECTPGRNPL